MREKIYLDFEFASHVLAENGGAAKGNLGEQGYIQNTQIPSDHHAYGLQLEVEVMYLYPLASAGHVCTYIVAAECPILYVPPRRHPNTKIYFRRDVHPVLLGGSRMNP
jgi:hypothetical protein